MPLRIDEFEIDEYNEDEMAKHSVTPREAREVLDSGDYRIHPNKKSHVDRQPYIMVGTTDGGRLLWIPIKPLDEQPGVWRPATAFTPQ